jgi:uncharacterized protein (DUF169 family)
MKQFLGALALGLAVVGSAHAAGQHYPTEFMVAAVKACADAADGVPRATARKYCACVLDGIEAKFRLGDAVELLSQIKGSNIPRPLRPIVGACLLEVAASADETL